MAALFDRLRTQHRAVFVAAIAVSGAFWLLPAASQANTPILSYSAVPGNTQAGGHPDVEVQFDLSNRFIHSHRYRPEAKARAPANARTPRTPPSTFPPVSSATRMPRPSARSRSSPRTPARSTRRLASSTSSRPIPSLPFDAALYNLVPPPDVAGLLGFKNFLFDTPQFTVLSARTGGDYGLDATATSIFHGAYPLQTFQEVLWGVPADPSHDFLRLNEEPSGVTHRAISASSATRTKS